MICHAKLSDVAAIQKINLEILDYNYDVGATKAQLARVLQQPEQKTLISSAGWDLVPMTTCLNR